MKKTFNRQFIGKVSPYYYVLFLFILVLISACGENNKEADADNGAFAETGQTVMKESDFPETQTLTLQRKNITGYFTRLTVFDTFLVCGNLRSPKLLNVYSARSGQLLGEIIERGAAANQGLSVADMQPSADGKYLWMYDITLGKFFKINVHKALADSAYLPETEITLAPGVKNIKSPVILDDSIIIATSYALGDCRYVYANQNIIYRKTGKLPPFYPNWHKEPEGSKLSNAAYIYSASLVKQPGQSRLAVIYSKTDRIELYENDSLVMTITGPDRFVPKPRFQKLKDRYDVNDLDDTRFAFTAACATKDQLYCLYSGKDKFMTCAAKIFVFGWDGSYKRIINLDKPVCQLYVDDRNGIHTIYCFDDKEKSVFSVEVKP